MSELRAGFGRSEEAQARRVRREAHRLHPLQAPKAHLQGRPPPPQIQEAFVVVVLPQVQEQDPVVEERASLLQAVGPPPAAVRPHRGPAPRRAQAPLPGLRVRPRVPGREQERAPRDAVPDGEQAVLGSARGDADAGEEGGRGGAVREPPGAQHGAAAAEDLRLLRIPHLPGHLSSFWTQPPTSFRL